MDYLDKYMNFLIDVYKTPLNIDWEIGPPLVGRFKVMDLEYKIYSDLVINGFMNFKYKKGDQLLNKEGYKISVIPTIKSGIDFILNNIYPELTLINQEKLDYLLGENNVGDWSSWKQLYNTISLLRYRNPVEGLLDKNLKSHKSKCQHLFYQ